MPQLADRRDDRPNPGHLPERIVRQIELTARQSRPRYAGLSQEVFEQLDLEGASLEDPVVGIDPRNRLVLDPRQAYLCSQLDVLRMLLRPVPEVR